MATDLEKLRLDVASHGCKFQTRPKERGRLVACRASCCWHFPCLPQCSETVDIIRARRKMLQTRDPSLLAEIDRAKRSTITILADGTYEDREVHIDGAIVVNFV
jgi:hypothetical protein